MRLKVIGPHELAECLYAIGAPPAAALKDGVLAMRYAASADLTALRRALALVAVDPPDLEEMDEDEARLLAAGVVARVLVHARRFRRERFKDDVQAVPGKLVDTVHGT